MSAKFENDSPVYAMVVIRLLCAIDRLQKYSNAGIKCFYVQSYRFIDNKSVKHERE